MLRIIQSHDGVTDLARIAVGIQILPKAIVFRWRHGLASSTARGVVSTRVKEHGRPSTCPWAIARIKIPIMVGISVRGNGVG